jgi:hypothetical protein
VTYTIRAVRWVGGWELHIDGVGVTQSTTLAGADRMVRDYLRLDGYTDHLTAALEYEYDGVGGSVAQFLEGQREAIEAQRAGREAAAKVRQALRELVDDVGLNGQEAARVLGISPQRVSQLMPKHGARTGHARKRTSNA